MSEKCYCINLISDRRKHFKKMFYTCLEIDVAFDPYFFRLNAKFTGKDISCFESSEGRTCDNQSRISLFCPETFRHVSGYDLSLYRQRSFKICDPRGLIFCPAVTDKN